VVINIAPRNQDFNGANLKLLNGGVLAMGMSKNVSGIFENFCCNVSFFSILFRFSAMKGPAKELRLSFMAG